MSIHDKFRYENINNTNIIVLERNNSNKLGHMISFHQILLDMNHNYKIFLNTLKENIFNDTFHSNLDLFEDDNLIWFSYRKSFLAFCNNKFSEGLNNGNLYLLNTNFELEKNKFEKFEKNIIRYDYNPNIKKVYCGFRKNY
jgi:hypothetical protein